MEKEILNEKTSSLAEKIPDIWFDLYARLIPGLIALFIYLFTFDKPVTFLIDNIWLMLFTAYLAGHIIQPFSSGLLNLFDKKLQAKKIPIVSKAYAELVGLFSCAIISIIIFFMYLLQNKFPSTYNYFCNKYWNGIFIFILFAITTIIRKKALNRKLSVHADTVRETIPESKTLPALVTTKKLPFTALIY
jgi:hypothetical protein